MFRTFVLAVIGISYGFIANAQEALPRNNLDVVQRLASDIGKRIANRLEGKDTVRLKVYPEESSWYVAAGLKTGLAEAGRVTTADDRSEITAEFFLHDLSIRYEEPRGDAVFGERIVDRAVTLSLAATITHGIKPIITDERFSQSMRDTVRLDDIERLENILIPASKGSMEEDGFFSTILEPVVLIGAIGVAVFLLFHVRS